MTFRGDARNPRAEQGSENVCYTLTSWTWRNQN